jgi:formamidopyrimidine-DNA glycosylase
MPELPEVETYVRDLAPLLARKRILGATVHWPRTIAHPAAQDFPRVVAGERFATFGRRGKYMLFGMESGQSLIVHLRMTGELRLHPANATVDATEGDTVDAHTHVILPLDSGEALHYRDQRKFGRIWLVGDVETVLHKLGPEPLGGDFTPEGLAQQLHGRTASVKALLLDQSIVAGVGNIYADEALFHAGIHPRRGGGSLNEEEIRRLHASVRWAIQRGIDLRGSTLGRGPQNYTPPNGIPGEAQDAHQVFRRTDLPCPRCGSPIQRIALAQRSTHFCPRCQR